MPPMTSSIACLGDSPSTSCSQSVINTPVEHFVKSESPFDDDEVSTYTSQTQDYVFPPFLPERCSSTDTIVSTSSTSTCISQVSTETEQPGNEPSNKRTGKRKRMTEYRRHPKPPYTYAAIVATAIWNSPGKQMTLNQIQTKMMEYFIFFRSSYRGWKDSVRHTLSQNPCFMKLDINVATKKMGIFTTKYIWVVDQTQLNEQMFARRDIPALAPDVTYAYYLHDELGLPPVPLADGETYRLGSPSKRRRQRAKAQRRSLETAAEISPGSLNLPTDRTFNQNNATAVQYVTESPASSTPRFDPAWLPMSSPTGYSPNPHLQQNVCDVMNYIVNTYHEERSSAAAIGSLSSLCSSLPVEYTTTETAQSFNSYSPISDPISNDDVIEPEPATIHSSPDASRNTILHYNFSVERFIRPISPDFN